ncbi:hypothetical protein F5I97DRAFT_393474 [Phlebopus sp. FC_14]|nr:hypothetical protein F5I97DRAFT_393474 [Phlebopus sp. FC_14]
MSAFHLRPVAEQSPSPSSSVSTTTAADHSPPPKPTTRRPLSPSSLRDVNLTQDANPLPRKYPAPPTGHELMALFPPASPANFPEMRPGPTSGFFQRQERAFFAQAGREIVRVRVEIDVPQQPQPHPHPHPHPSSTSTSVPSSDESHPAGKPIDQPPQQGGNGNGGGGGAPPRTWPQLPPHPQHHSPVDPPAIQPVPYPPHSKSSRPPRGLVVAPVPSSTTMFPVSPHGQQQPPQPPLNLHAPVSHHTPLGLRTPPHDVHPAGPVTTKLEFQPPEEYREDGDDAWRRPTPYADRRRAGKHTRRVIVRN